MSRAQVTTEHRRKALDIINKLGCPQTSFNFNIIAQALADAEAGEREACADIVLTCRLSNALPSHSREVGLLRGELCEAIRARGQS